MIAHSQSQPFSDAPPIAYVDPAMSALQRVMVRAVERVGGQRKLKAVYDGFRADGGAPETFWDEMMRRTGITPRFDDAALRAIPATGPLLIVANHPYGLVDGFGLCWLASKIRPDFRLLINSVLVQAPETRDFLLPLDFSGTAEATATNIRSRAEARRYLEEGGLVLVFPAGAISTAPDPLGRRPAMDGPWQAFVGQLLQRARCPVVPIYFHGQNSRLFQIASHRSSTIRLAMMAGEVRRRFGTPLDATIGTAIGYAEFAAISGRAALAAELCRRTYALGGIDTTKPGMIVPWPKSLQDKPRKPAGAPGFWRTILPAGRARLAAHHRQG
ncbi:MAG: lysophospholipid acyltransferase family protein [Alphaproteobacteria bacterium]|nr:lysophospholipid acyltransferase family protein [Alphaproteobacteria bacterium]